jgi:hypothetical protein
MPGRKDENWRFANTGLLQFDAFKRVPAAEASAFDGLGKTSARIVTVNDEVIRHRSSVLGEGLEVLRLPEALARHGDRLRDLLVSPDAKLGAAKFAALHHAQLSEAAVIIAPAGADI